jgi:hypothetical protein
MPRMGIPSSYISIETVGAFNESTLAGPPESTSPQGCRAFISSMEILKGYISE